MGRRIFTGVPEGQAMAAGGLAPTTDGYLDRLAKYIPAEIVGLYLFAAGVIPQTGGGRPVTALWIVFGVCFALTPAYMYVVTRREGHGKALWLQVVLATIAFPVWVFAIGGPFLSVAWYQSWIASIVLAFVTFGFGAFVPAPGD